jgi:2-polyprenyl-3-methyl-5-hydroxy-6-metoxy-1,4-benzoquinol methylase
MDMEQPSMLSHSIYPYPDNPRTPALALLPSQIRVLLDVGCAYGAFGAAVQQQQPCEVWGIEPHQPAAEKAALRLQHVLNTTVEKAIDQLPDQYFDCIVFNDVLEHLENPWLVLSQLRSKLGPSGRVVAIIPNIRYFKIVEDLVLHGQWDYQESGILDRTHLRFFTKSAVRDLFRQSGYELERLEGLRGARFPWKFRLLNLALLGALNEMRYHEFGCVAAPLAPPHA